MPLEAHFLDEEKARGPGMLALGEPVADFVLEGHVDFYGYHAAARGWFFGGWMSHPWPVGDRPRGVSAGFATASDFTHDLTTFYDRADVAGRGIGFIFFLRGDVTEAEGFRGLDVSFSQGTYRIPPTPAVVCLSGPGLVDELHPILAGGEEGSQRRQMLQLIAPGRGADAAGGFVDFYGHHHAAGGWMFMGWVSRGWRHDRAPPRVIASFEEGEIAGEALVATYARPDLKDGAMGASFFLPGTPTPLGSLCWISFEVDGIRFTLFPGATVQRLREADMVALMRPVVAAAPPAVSRDGLLAMLGRQPYAGQDTLAALNGPVFLEIDEAIICEPDGLVLIGWCLAKPGIVREMRVRCADLSTVLDLSQAIAVDRPDVLASLSGPHGFDDPRCGFIAFVPRSVVPGATLYIEVETARHEIGFRGVPRGRMSGMAAIKRLLECVEPRFAEVAPAFDRVIGPAVEMLNRGRLRRRPTVEVIDYGHVPPAPEASVIVPLYRRMDFVEYQLALFSAHPGSANVEFIYVLDDPPRRREAQALFASVHERFGTPFRVLLLDRNVGYAPANNIGLEHARGRFVAFLNSDVFPGTPDWLERLAGRLVADPGLGVVGAALLFEDGSVQHRGIYFRRLREFGDWFFPQHEGKGLRSGRGGGLRRSLGITGACMVMERALAKRVGGFDEIYAIGDFEDTDLCLKLQALGFACGVDTDVELYHLERQSQAGSAQAWRMNLTLYNSWQHDRRWSSTIAAHEASHAG